jgi:hypothetical protein
MMGMKKGAPLCSLCTRIHNLGSSFIQDSLKAGCITLSHIFDGVEGLLFESVSRAPVSADCKWFKAVRSEWFVEAVVSRFHNLVEVDGQAE